MKPSLTSIFLMFFFFAAFISHSQKYSDNSRLRSYPDSYSLDQLPDQWKKKPKILRAVDDILPAAINQLKGRRSCTNCKADFYASVKLDTLWLDSETVEDQSTRGDNADKKSYITTSFRFRSYFSISDSIGREVGRMIIADPREDNYVIHEEYDLHKGVSIPVIYLMPAIAIDPNRYLRDIHSSGLLLNDNLLLDYTADKLKTIRSRIKKFEVSGSE